MSYNARDLSTDQHVVKGVSERLVGMSNAIFEHPDDVALIKSFAYTLIGEAKTLNGILPATNVVDA